MVRFARRRRGALAGWAIAGGLVVAVSAGVAPASAQAGGDVAVFPTGESPGQRPLFAYDLPPGAVIEDSVTVANYADEPRTFQVYATDGFNTGDLGTFTLRRADEPVVGVGAWLQLATDRWTVPARSRVDIPFRFEVPVGAAPGDHVGGIVALRTTATNVDGFGLDVERGIGARVYVRVPGAVTPGLAIDDLQTELESPGGPFGVGRAVTSFVVANTGNVRANPTVTFRASGPFGEIVEEEIGRFADLLPGSRVVVRHEWSGVPFLGPVTQTVTLTDGDLTYARSTSNWVLSWWVLAAAGSPLVVGALVVRRRRRATTVSAADLTRAAVVLLVVSVGLTVGGVDPAAAAGPELDLGTQGVVPVGDRLAVTGTGWPGGSNVAVEVCGNGTSADSSDCAVGDGRVTTSSPDGRFVTELEVADPPVPCPCVVRARTVTGEALTVSAPLDIAGASVAVDASLRDDVRSPVPGLAIEAWLEGGDSLGSLLGLGAQRTLVLEAENTGDVMIDDPVVSAGWRAGSDGLSYLPLVELGPLRPGERVERRVDVSFGPPLIGEVHVEGEVTGAGEPVSFATTTTSVPWLLVAGCAVSPLLVVGWLLRRRRRRARGGVSGRAAPAVAGDWDEELAGLVAGELDDVHDHVRALYPALERDDELAIRVVVERAHLSAARIAGKVPLADADRRQIEDAIAFTVLAAFDLDPNPLLAD